VRERPRIAVLFPEYGLIDGHLHKLADRMGADILMFKVPAYEEARDPDTFVGDPNQIAGSVLLMGSLETLRKVGKQAGLVHPDAVVWACTSGSYMGPPEVISRQTEVLSEAAGAPATTTTIAVLKAIADKGMKRVCVVTPYPEIMGVPFVEMLRSKGIEVLGHAHASQFNEEGISGLTVEDYKPLAQQAWRDGADGWVLPCTAVQAEGIEAWFEKEYGVPVVLANPATFAHAIELARQPALAGR
jgi:maleate cis-trans isomerase